ncbi:MAG: lysophospholipase [Candidatus Dormibacteria bacterium]
MKPENAPLVGDAPLGVPREGWLAGVRGLNIFYRTWRHEMPRAQVVVVHGYGEHGGRYARLAGRLVGRGYEVIVPDHRGHGRSEGRPISVISFDDYVDDLRRLLVKVRREQLAGNAGSALPVFMLGHSMGGLIALAFALDRQQELSGLVLSAPAVVRPAHVSATTIRLGRMLARVAPWMGTVQLPVHLISRDPGVVAAYKRDPLVHRRRVRARLGSELLRVIDDVDRRLPELMLPVLLLQGGSDGIVDPGAARHVHDRIASRDRTLHEYGGLHHEIFNEPEHAQVTEDLLGWLDSHSA